MKNLIKIPIEFAFLSCILAGCANAQKVDLSTDKAVREQLAKNSEFISKLDRLCIERPTELANIIVIGTHANDSDCQIDGAFVNSVYFDDGPTLSQNALKALGWMKANPKERKEMAKIWVEKGLMAFFTVLYTKGKDFQPYRGITYRGGQRPSLPEFHPPQVVSNEKGEVIVTMWVSFMSREKMFRHYKFSFTNEGSRRED